MIPTAKSHAAVGRNMDRRVIRIDFPPTHAGITAALKHAFTHRSHDAVDDDFDDLLNQIP